MKISLVVGAKDTQMFDQFTIDGEQMPIAGWSIEGSVKESPVLVVRIPLRYVHLGETADSRKSTIDPAIKPPEPTWSDRAPNTSGRS